VTLFFDISTEHRKSQAEDIVFDFIDLFGVIDQTKTEPHNRPCPLRPTASTARFLWALSV